MMVCIMIPVSVQLPLQKGAYIATNMVHKQSRAHKVAGHTYEIMTLDKTSEFALRFEIIVFLED